MGTLTRNGIIYALILPALLGCVNIDVTIPWWDIERPLGLPTVEVGDIEYILDVADSETERVEGLSRRPYLPPDRGMLFMSDAYENQVGTFWMKDMRFPLDFVWIGATCEVVDIHAFAPIPLPFTPDEHITRFTSRRPALYALEINAGDTERYDIEVGDYAEFSNVAGVSCD